ncbi:MAG: topoisomerase DNA-binding C4 zinc finger domain-containing protein, partial [Clostridia bacterium]|nr:topoisomerase DNA-binding C4 zinc finger domain-containing protein [Clostridia bacterium]
DGESTMNDVLSSFYVGFAKNLDAAEEKAREFTVTIPAEQTDIICDKCGSTMIIKNGKFGKFAACPNYPECRNTKPLDNTGKPKTDPPEPAPTGLTCELCSGALVLRNGRYGNFYACENFPKCKFTKQITKDTGVACPKCSAKIVTKHGKNNTFFYSCECYPECDFSSWDQPTNHKCPECGSMLMKKKGKALLYCLNHDCSYTEQVQHEESDS